MSEVAERDIQKAIMQYLGLRGFVFKRNQSGMTFLNDAKYGKRAIRMGEPGWPDLIGMTKEGRFVGIEVKTRTGLVSENQQAIIQRINGSGGMAFVARSVDDVVARGF